MERVSSRADFDAALSARPSVVVVEFMAGWCRNCKHISASLARMSASDVRSPRPRRFLQVDTEENDWAVDEFGVASLPHVMVFVDGEKVAEAASGDWETVQETIVRATGPLAAAAVVVVDGGDAAAASTPSSSADAADAADAATWPPWPLPKLGPGKFVLNVASFPGGMPAFVLPATGGGAKSGGVGDSAWGVAAGSVDAAVLATLQREASASASASAVAAAIQRRLLRLYGRFLSLTGDAFRYSEAASSSEFAQFVHFTLVLQQRQDLLDGLLAQKCRLCRQARALELRRAASAHDADAEATLLAAAESMRRAAVASAAAEFNDGAALEEAEEAAGFVCEAAAGGAGPCAASVAAIRCFFLNLYNALVIHASIAVGSANSPQFVALSNGGGLAKFFGGCCYAVSGHLYSLDDMEHGVLRANQLHPTQGVRYFPTHEEEVAAAAKKRQAADALAAEATAAAAAAADAAADAAQEAAAKAAAAEAAAVAAEALAAEHEATGGDPRRRLVVALDPRIHFALVCGARSCPPIRLFKASNLNSALDLAAAAFCNGETDLSEEEVAPEEGSSGRVRQRLVVLTSRLFFWYGKDFAVEEADRLRFLARYCQPEKQQRILDHLRRAAESPDTEAAPRIAFRDYDWRVNDTPK